MDWYDIFNILILLACARGLFDLWRRIRSGELSIWEIKKNLKQMGILCVVVFILCLVFVGIADNIAPGRISTGDFIRGYIVMVIFLLIIWGIGRERSKHYDEFDH